MGKILSISLKLNFTPNTLGCYGLTKLKLKVERLRLNGGVRLHGKKWFCYGNKISDNK